MKDERLQRELNIIKGKVLNIVTIFVTAVFLVKIVYFRSSVNFDYYVELYLLIVVLITYILRYTIFKNKEDERIQLNIERLMNISFLLAFFGSFFIHFYMVSKQLENNLMFNINFTSTFLLIGSVIFVFLLRKREIYGNYKWIELEKKQYIKRKVKEILVFSLVFLTNIVFFILNDAHDDFLVGVLIIIYSLISLIIVYLMYALYEKNHFDERLLIDNNKKRLLTKNAGLFLIVPMIFSIARNITNSLLIYKIMSSGSLTDGVELSLLQRILNWYSLDISILMILSFVVIHNYIKIAIPKLSSLLTIIKVYIYIYSVSSLLSYASTILAPLLGALLDLELFVKIMSIVEYSSFVFMFIFLVFHIIMGIHMEKYRIKYLYLFWMFSLAPIIGLVLSRVSMKYEIISINILSTIITSSILIFLFVFFKLFDNTVINNEKVS